MPQVLKAPPRLPLWRLEMLREQAERRFQRTEAEHRAAANELNSIREQIAARHKEISHD